MTRIEKNARKILDFIREARQLGDRLGTIYCCLEARFMREGLGCELEFQTAARYLKRKGLVV